MVKRIFIQPLFNTPPLAARVSAIRNNFLRGSNTPHKGAGFIIAGILVLLGILNCHSTPYGASNTEVVPLGTQSNSSISSISNLEDYAAHLNSKIEQWKVKEPDLFKEYPELEGLLKKINPRPDEHPFGRVPDRSQPDRHGLAGVVQAGRIETIKLLLSSRFWQEAIEIPVYLMIDPSRFQEVITETDKNLYDEVFRLLEKKQDVVIKKIIKFLSYPDVILRDNSIFILKNLSLSSKNRQESIEEIMKLLPSSKAWIRKTAVEALWRLKAKETIPEILKLSSDSDAEVRKTIVKALWSLQVKETIPEILKFSSDSDAGVRTTIVKAFWSLQIKEAIPQMLEFLSDSDAGVRKTAIKALWGLSLTGSRGPEGQAKELIPHLLKLLSDSDAEVRKTAVEALWGLSITGSRGPEGQAKEAIPQMLKLLSDSDAGVRKAAIEALWSLKVREAIPQMIKLLSDSDALVRRFAVSALGNFQVREAIPQMLKLLSDSDALVRRFAVSVLVDLLLRSETQESLSRQGQAKEVIPGIVKLLSDSDAGVRVASVYALGDLFLTGSREGQFKEAIPEILKLLSDSDALVRAAAVYTLKDLDAKEAIPQLIKLLSDSDAGVRVASIEALGVLLASRPTGRGSPEATLPRERSGQAKEAIPEIKKLLSDLDANVREAATKTISELETK